MLLTLRQQLSRFSHILQSELFPILESELGERSETGRRLVATLELIPLGRFIPSSQGWNGRPPRDRHAIARALVAKAVYNLLRTSDLPEARKSRKGKKQMLKELPRNCSIGVKTSSKGHQQYWRGYKLHLDVADGQIPVSAVLTGASVHDSQVAIPLATMTARRVTHLYELMDSAYDAAGIIDHMRGMSHVPIIDPRNVGRKTKSTFLPGKSPRRLSGAEADRYRERTMVERVYARLKDEFGGRYVRVRGANKVMAHLMFGVLALTADQLLRLGAGSP